MNRFIDPRFILGFDSPDLAGRASSPTTAAKIIRAYQVALQAARKAGDAFQKFHRHFKVEWSPDLAIEAGKIERRVWKTLKSLDRARARAVAAMRSLGCDVGTGLVNLDGRVYALELGEGQAVTIVTTECLVLNLS